MQTSQQTTIPSERVYDVTEQSITPGVKSVLMLEDDVAFAEIVRSFLESHSFQVTCVTNGADGVREALAKEFDIVLCDLVMPHLPGDKFYLAIERARKPLCKRFVFMTGYRAEARWDRFLSKVSGPVLEKPFHLDDLLSTIQTVLTENELSRNNSV